MFGHHSGSGGFSPLWIFASVAFGVLLNSTQCSSAQAQSHELSFRDEGVMRQEMDDMSAGTPRREHAQWVEKLESKEYDECPGEHPDGLHYRYRGESPEGAKIVTWHGKAGCSSCI